MPCTLRAGPVAVLLGLALGCLALGPALGPGFVLVQDMVFVPDPVFTRFTFGLAGSAPRVVPSDAVVTALSWVLPADVVQKAILLGVFVLGCSGAALLVPSERLVPRLVAGTFYVWNPYVAERLLMGQWALLLGYAALPWVVRAAGSARRSAVAMAPAAAGGFAAMTIAALTALATAMFAEGRVPWSARVARVVRVAAVLAGFSLPWLVPTLLRPGVLTGDAIGVEAFAARADGPFGAVGSLLSLGGIWNAQAVPVGYDTVVGAVGRLVLCLAGIAGFAAARGLPYRRGLAVAAAAGFGIACLGVTAAGRAALGGLVEAWGGFAVFRDAQQFVAPLALLAAVGLGLLTARAMEGGRVPEGPEARGGARWAGAMLLAPLAVLPTMAWGAAGALEAVGYPGGWTAAREVIRSDVAPGDVLILPFESYRRFPWNGNRAVLDPAQRFFAAPGRDVVAADTVRVDGMVVGSEDERARSVERVIAGPSPDLAGAGFLYVVVDAGTPAELRRFASWLHEAELLVNTPELRLYRLT